MDDATLKSVLELIACGMCGAIAGYSKLCGDTVPVTRRALVDHILTGFVAGVTGGGFLIWEPAHRPNTCNGFSVRRPRENTFNYALL